MAIIRFRPEIWTALLLSSLKTSHVYAALCNRDYEGEIRAAGDTVRITSISRPVINDYERYANINYEQLSDAQRTLVIDQEKYWAFEVDDVDAVQARGNVVPEAMTEAAHGLSDVADRFMAGHYTGVQAANNLGTVPLNETPDNGDPRDSMGRDSYRLLVKLGETLDTANVPSEGRWVVIPPVMHSRLQWNPNFINAEKSADGGTALRNGFIGRAAGFNIHKSNNTPNPTSDHRVVIAGVQMAASMAEQILSTEAMRSEQRFADRVRGLHVYGGKLVRPDAWAIATINPTP